MNKTGNALMVALLIVVASIANTAHSSQCPAPTKPPQEAIYPTYLESEGCKLAIPTLLVGLPFGYRPDPPGKAVFGYPASDNDPVLMWYRQAKRVGEEGRRRDVSLVEYCPGGREVSARWEITKALPVGYKQVKREDRGVGYTETQVEFEHQGIRLVKWEQCDGSGASNKGM